MSKPSVFPSLFTMGDRCVVGATRRDRPRQALTASSIEVARRRDSSSDTALTTQRASATEKGRQREFPPPAVEAYAARKAMETKGLLELHASTGIFQLLLDRKSTRLNSSHVAISYAVFCLKKKETTQLFIY